MAAARLPIPGSKYGPCLDICAHRDCAATRAEAAAICRLCAKPIGYEVRFYSEGALGLGGDRTGRFLVHANCAEREIEAEQRTARERAIP